jgi:nucleotide-binding universal stress UspA family protein
MKVLVAIDSSSPSQVAVDEVAARPWPKATTVRILSMVESGRFREIQELVEPATQAAQSLVKNAAQRIEARLLGSSRPIVQAGNCECAGYDELAISTDVIKGHPRTAIVEYAERWGADFVVVGSHGLGGFTRFVMGSTAQAVVRHARCSVEVARAAIAGKARAADGMRILLATDGSDCSVAAARSIAERPWPAGSEVKVVSAIDLVAPATEPWYLDASVMARLEEGLAEQAQDAVKAAEKIISGAGLKASVAVPVGNPKAVVLDEAKEWGADLVVVGSHGRHGIDRVLMGSTSEAVAMHAHCSVEVIRERLQASRS